MSGVEIDLRLERGSFRLDCSIRAPGRGVTAIFGASGAGKTTLLRCVAGLERAEPGRVAVNEQLWQDSPRGVFEPTHRRRLGYVFQDAGLFPHLSVRGNLRYVTRRRGRTATPGLDCVTEWMGIGALLERTIDGLSGGEKQRVAVARALLGSPELLLLDEPLASLDERARAGILPYLETLHRELAIPVLYVSHSRTEVMRLSDHVVLLDRGRVRAAGDVTEMLSLGDAPATPDAEIATIVEARVVAHDEDYGLSCLEIPGGRLTLPGSEHLPPGSQTRLRLLARDLSLTLDPPGRTSILNVLRGRVVEVRNAAEVLPLISVDVGGTRLWARITRKSVAALELKAGREVFVQVKGVALVQ